MSQGYQTRDAAIVDYRLWQASHGGMWLRGPKPEKLEPGGYFACVGAAQTFGCFVEQPWPQMLSDELGLPVLNLGLAGAGPALFRQEPMLKLLREARFVVFQVMSGRSADCSRFVSGGTERLQLQDGRRLGADAAWTELLHQDLAGTSNRLMRGLKNRWFATFGRKDVHQLVQETRDNWTREFCELIDATARPSALLWFSKRTPQHHPRLHSLRALFGEFPQLVDERMVQAVAEHTEHYVECVTSRGSPQPLATPVRPSDAGTDKASDVAWTHNAYYPSPEMHEDARNALRHPVQALLAATHSDAT
ncbi:MAG: hypothetical protein ACI8UD_002961 [Planctomycetota bacterium]|jgi:hypothetical protein